MVILLDLDDEPHDAHVGSHPVYDNLKHQLRGPLLHSGSSSNGNSQDVPVAPVAEERANPNLNGFSAALSCYPIVASLASHLDLNSLHDLSRTCRQFRANLLQYRKQLIAQSLRCSKEKDERNCSLAARFRESHAAWVTNGEYSNTGRITSGKIGQCARDKVGECRRCGIVVCRNCIAKPPPIPALIDRHRRLCKTCIRAPLNSLLTSPRHNHDDLDDQPSPSSSPSTSPSRLYRIPTPPAEDRHTSSAFTATAFLHAPCSCPDEVWLCQTCGRGLRDADSRYKGSWAWRKSYSTIGGFGAGIGEGIEALPCGRKEVCLGAKLVEQEIDCDPDTLREMEEQAEKIASEGTGRSWQGTSFAVQEMEGIGGVVKKKIKKLARVGKKVTENEDERSGQSPYLQREQLGVVRSWCAWCERVIPSKKDLDLDYK